MKSFLCTLSSLIFISVYSQVMDIDGNQYKTVKIGNKTWMAENLKTTKYNDGKPIPNITDNKIWVTATTPAYSWYNNDVSYKPIFGALYNFYSVNTGKLCPSGWRIPTNDDIRNLVETIDPDFTPDLGHISMVAGGKLKSTSYWSDVNVDASNESGFSGVGAGCRSWAGTFNVFGYFGYFWTSEKWSLDLRWATGKTFLNDGAEEYVGLSVRCVQEFNGEAPFISFLNKN